MEAPVKAITKHRRKRSRKNLIENRMEPFQRPEGCNASHFDQGHTRERDVGQRVIGVKSMFLR